MLDTSFCNLGLLCLGFLRGLACPCSSEACTLWHSPEHALSDGAQHFTCRLQCRQRPSKKPSSPLGHGLGAVQRNAEVVRLARHHVSLHAPSSSQGQTQKTCTLTVRGPSASTIAYGLEVAKKSDASITAEHTALVTRAPAEQAHPSGDGPCTPDTKQDTRLAKHMHACPCAARRPQPGARHVRECVPGCRDTT